MSGTPWPERLLAGVALIALSPVLAAIAAAIVLSSGRPVFFRQPRVGLHGAPFEIWKFRSMRKGSAGPAITAAQDRRTTSVGAILRRFKLDELPQLWNIATGSMRFVGPRPEIPRFVDLADPVWQRILSVPPGITDPATLLYRNEEMLLSGAPDVEEHYRQVVLPKKLQFSLEYLDIRSWTTDLAIISFTVIVSFIPSASSALQARWALSLAKRAS
jgi:lipopolysaccharide/colanic/teichoic acid biosynthesis glycosyltransferase